MREAAQLAPLGRLEEGWASLPTLVTTVAELDLAVARRGPCVRYFGPILEEVREREWKSPFSDGDERPLVLVSFSTTRFWDPLGRIRNTLDALESEPVRVLVLAPEAESVHAVPRNAVVQTYVPHGLVLPHAELTVTHCGHGTVTAALSHGVPILALPNAAADQPYLAERVKHLGAGIALDGAASADEIRAAVREILAREAYAARARELGAVIAASPGASWA